MDNTQDVEITLGQQIKNALEVASADGLKRTQRWLSTQTGIAEVALSNKLAGYDGFKENELFKINEVLGTDFK
jgi:hypothetical protein